MDYPQAERARPMSTSLAGGISAHASDIIPQRPATVMQEMDELFQVIDSHEKILEAATARLVMVTAIGSAPPGITDQTNKVDPAICEHADRIRSARRCIQRLSKDVQILLSRLEL